MKTNLILLAAAASLSACAERECSPEFFANNPNALNTHAVHCRCAEYIRYLTEQGKVVESKTEPVKPPEEPDIRPVLPKKDIEVIVDVEVERHGNVLVLKILTNDGKITTKVVPSPSEGRELYQPQQQHGTGCPHCSPGQGQIVPQSYKSDRVDYEEVRQLVLRKNRNCEVWRSATCVVPIY